MIGSVTAQAGAQHAHRNPMQQVLAPAAQLLGLGDAELRSQLQSGKTLAQLASDKGVARDDLLSAVQQGLQDVGARSDDLVTVAANIVDGKGFPKPPPPRPQTDGAQRLDALTSALGIDSSTLFRQLESGSTLGAIASQHGLSSTDLSRLLDGPLVDVSA